MRESKLGKIGYELRSVEIIQAPVSYIEHRCECDPTTTLCGRKVYPVIVAPMGAVTDEHNYKTWLDNGFICVVPRTVSISKRLEIMHETFASFSLDEATTVLMELDDVEMKYVCIDVAHGTMNSLYDVCRKLKERFCGSIEIMTGNVANPEAYSFYGDCGIDFMRMSIGTGSRCTSACNDGVHYPVASLIDEMATEKSKWESTHGPSTKIIADGGISNFDDIQKCLALGADFVMSGNIFARATEACGGVVYMDPDGTDISEALSEDDYLEMMAHSPNDRIMKYRPCRIYYGMSTKMAQTLTGGTGKKTSEGIVRPVRVEYPIAKWADNMKSFLISAMSYTGARTLDEFRENAEVIINLSGDGAYRK